MCQRGWEQVGLPSFMDLAAVDYLRVQDNTSHCLVQGQDTRCKGHALGPSVLGPQPDFIGLGPGLGLVAKGYERP